MIGCLKGSIPVRIYYEDTDALGMVYHANYLKFFDRAREELLSSLLIQQLADQGIVFVVSRISMHCLASARHGDQLIVESELEYSRSPRLRAYQTIKRAEQILVNAEIEFAAIDRRGRPTRLPTDFLASLSGLKAHHP